MATFFQSFRSSSMPKRLVRYALSRLDLLETDTLDMDNLDLALGRNTVFEFRDVRIKLKKLEKLLKLPKSFRLDRARILLLKVTVPMDFYTSPIIIEVDGVDVRLQLLGPDGKPTSTPGSKTPDSGTIVPNTTDLAQSFLETQSPKERKELEEALAAETQDLGASLSVSSDDGSEDDFPAGTGQALSLPTFMADFLQGIIDRMQVKIKGVTFQLDLKVLPDASSTVQEPVSAQISLDSIDIEGVTTHLDADSDGDGPVAKDGKRHIGLHEVRASLISEANVFSALAQSASPSMASSPAMTRNPPSREATMEASGTPMDRSTNSIQTTASAHLRGIDDDPFGNDHPLADSEEALSIPYDLSDEEVEDEGSPPTPRASMYHDMGDSFFEQSVFHSTNLSDSAASDPPGLGEDRPRLWESAHSESPFDRAMRTESGLSGALSQSNSLPTEEPFVDDQVPAMAASQTSSNSEDLTMSHLYTHEEAQSMYQSAFSNADLGALDSGSTKLDPEPSSLAGIRPEVPSQPKTSMPGAWDDGDDDAVSTVLPVRSASLEDAQAEAHNSNTAADNEEESSSLPQLEGSDNAADVPQDRLDDHDDVATPKGPTRLVKEILRLKSLSLYIPTHHRHIQVHAASPDSVAQLAQSLNRSYHPQAPGAFSTQLPPRRPSSGSQDSADPKPSSEDRALEIDLSPVTVSFDASLGFLLAMVAGKLMDAMKRDQTDEANQASQAVDPTSTAAANTDAKPATDIRLTLQEISVNFLNRLGGVADTSERYLDPSAFSFSHDVLLNLTLRKLNLATSPADPKTISRGRAHIKNQSASLTKIEIESFRFGYANGDILSFDRSVPMSTSVRDTFLSSGHDIGVKLHHTADGTQADVETLRLVVDIDLQRLDETFSWFGGLSSFLNMSASMTSASSPVRDSPVPLPKPRGVRFETPINPNDKSAASSNKVNVRIGGATIELVGRECSVLLESSAVKIVSRSEGLGVAVTSFRVLGPNLRNSSAPPSVAVDFGGLRLDFLSTPQEADLDRLVELIVPSKARFDRNNDELMLDTLLRQRRKGSVLKISIDNVKARVGNMAALVVLPNLAEEIQKLSTVAKYLPEYDRPGLLTLGSIQKIQVNAKFDGKLGHFEGEIKDLGIAHITLPSLVAVAVHHVKLTRNEVEELVATSKYDPSALLNKDPVIMARMIGDEIDPVVKLKLQNLVVEYRVPTIMDVLGLGADATPQDFEESLAASVVDLGEQARSALAREPASPTEAVSKSKQSKPLTLDVEFRDCVLGLNPHELPARLAVVLLDAHLSVDLPKDVETRAALDINKASVLLVDDASQSRSGGVSSRNSRRVSASTSKQVMYLSSLGYVEVCFTSSAKAIVDVKAGADGEKHVNVELRDDLLVLETCADSTQTLITVANGLKPPTPPSKENKFRTKVMPVQDLLASISAEAFGRPEGEYDFDQDFAGAQEMAGAGSDSEPDFASDGSLHIESQFYGNESQGEELFDATKASGISEVPGMEDTHEGVLLTGFTQTSGEGSISSDDLVIYDNFFGAAVAEEEDQVAKIWNSKKNTYDRAPANIVKRSPLRVSVRDVHVIWNLFDGYDWEHTRDVITQAVQEVENKAFERQARTGHGVYEEEIEDEETIGDLLFNSIYIGIPANRDPQELARAINEGLHDNATETESVAATTVTASTNRTARPREHKPKRLRLQRSRRHKITFELSGIDVDLLAYPPGFGETLSSMDVRVKSLDVFDHVPTSTWKKFATYDQDAGEREMGTSMVHLELLNVKPLPELGASEMVLRVTVLPLRLHVDQDALDFITRFFEFKDEKVPVHASPSDVPFVQRAEINNIPVKLDFKPKRVDYAGLRSGHTTEFMNFIVLDEARLVLRHVIIYGASGFDRLGKTLNATWTPDVRNNQLPGVIAGLAPVRSLVNIGSGFRDLVEIPLKEYQKDGRVLRSISKGAVAFARTTGTEMVKLGAKLAVGTQYALQGAEGLLAEQSQNPGSMPWDDEELDEEERKQISLYADQPTGVIQGLRGGYRSLARDVNLARDAIIAVPGEVMQSQGPGGAARAVLKKAPTIIFRPAMGVTKAIGQTLMGATNTMDPQNRRRVDEKYKKH